MSSCSRRPDLAMEIQISCRHCNAKSWVRHREVGRFWLPEVESVPIPTLSDSPSSSNPVLRDFEAASVACCDAVVLDMIFWHRSIHADGLYTTVCFIQLDMTLRTPSMDGSPSSIAKSSSTSLSPPTLDISNASFWTSLYRA